MGFDLGAASGQPTTNYLVPAGGATHVVPVNGALTAGQPVTLDWRNFDVQSFPFQPQGAYIDNTANTGQLTIAIYANGPNGTNIWTIVVDAGYVLHTPFPAPNGQAHVLNTTVTGNVTIVYADFPVMPLLYKP